MADDLVHTTVFLDVIHEDADVGTERISNVRLKLYDGSQDPTRIGIALGVTDRALLDVFKRTDQYELIIRAKE